MIKSRFTSGLDQLGAKSFRDINEPIKWKRKLRNGISINSRVGISRSKRKVKITLPKLKFMENEDDN